MTVGGLDEIESTEEHKVLGSNWNLDKDTLVLKLDKVVEFGRNLEPTKRNVLRIAAKLFDPLGLISPVTVVVRMLLQNLCANKSEWDNIISESDKKLIQDWLKDLEKVQRVVIRRYYFPEETRRVRTASLHGFGDASKGAYCAVVYLCIWTGNRYTTSLVASKSRVTPLAPMSIPRLELIAALILARLITSVKEALKSVISIDQVHCWTDSITVFYWLQADKEYKQFVQNRVDEILRLTEAKNWRHCPGIENPADIGSRGRLASELVNNKMWWEGPNWLRESPEHYPKAQASDEPADLPDECTKEVRARQQTRENHTHGTVLVNAAQETATHRSTKLLEVIDCARYSTCTKLFRVTALVLKFVSILKERRDKSRSAPGELSSKEISEARKTWIREIQRQSKEQNTLTQQLGLYKDEDDILRATTRRGKPTTLKRPVQKLFPLEVSAQDSEEETQTPTQADDGVDDNCRASLATRPPRRAAAMDADAIRRLIGQQ